MKELFEKLYWIFRSQFGFDPRRLVRSLKGIPRYVFDLARFRKVFNGKLGLRPCLYDWFDEGGATNHEYFWQDLYFAQKINQAKPVKHVDVGSRIDGFVAHLASFRETEVFDIRSLTTQIPGVIFKQADLMNPGDSVEEYCDSLSCLHALEHFGLGRYGDPIDPSGFKIGLKNMAMLLKPGGSFYLSVPIGDERVEFNAHRVFNPSTLVQLAATYELQLEEFLWIEDGKNFMRSTDPQKDMERLAGSRYSLGLFTFRKNEANE
jgi:SAM-dependent methyltransferase